MQVRSVVRFLGNKSRVAVCCSMCSRRCFWTAVYHRTTTIIIIIIVVIFPSQSRSTITRSIV